MSTYTPISSFVLGSATSTVTLNNIPGTYTDLVLVAKFDRSVADSGSWFRINNDSGSNYSTTEIRGNGSNATSGRDTSVTVGRYFRGLSNQTTDNFFVMHLMDYANTNTNKTILTRGGIASGTGAGAEANVNLWRSTSAITEINLITASGTYSAGSIFNLYGIQNASLQAVKATGGNHIATDGEYWYHAFTSSGTFTPSSNITNADFLVVAGGGGAFDYGGGAGGGGAGGLRTSYGSTSGGGSSAESKVSFTSGTAYTVTVGAGGAVQTHNSGGTPASAGNGSSSSIAGSGFTTITSTGGGGGADYSNAGGTTGNGATGGSGGGAASSGPYTYTGGSGTANQGYSGGNSIPNASFGGNAGGGGGAGGAGQNPTSDTGTNDGGVGGAGLAVAITGTNVTYAAGGKGGRNNGAIVNGTVNTGNGGARGSSGGSGIVIVRYAV